MIPDFPGFTPINIAQKDLLEKFLSNYEPYSDFNFASLLCWNIDGSTEVSNLGGNLVIKLPHYIDGRTCYSVLGHKNIDESLVRLLSISDRLDFVPEIVINSVEMPNKFKVTEDPDHFDYIYSLEEHSNLPGKKYKSKRNVIGKFSRAYNHEISTRKIDFTNQQQVEQLEHTFTRWHDAKLKNNEHALMEAQAIERLIKFGGQLNLIGFELVAGEKILGFSIVEIAHGGYALFHFHKTHSSEPGSDAYLTNQVSKYLHEQGCTLINWEQDLGIEGLRHSKTRYRPVKMLKKYQVLLASH